MRFPLRIIVLVGLAVVAGLVGLGMAYASGVFTGPAARSAESSRALPNVPAGSRHLPRVSVVASPSAVDAAPTVPPRTAAPSLAVARPVYAAGCPSRFPPYFLRFPKWQPVSPCVSATGVVVSVALQPDGDYHVDIVPDPGSRWLLNAANVTALGGLLRTEIVPQYELAGVPIRTPVPPPRPGMHIRASGAEVLDVGHAGWTEIHPVYSWSVL